jgi:uncharacterized protein (DUF2164 family)
MITPELDKYYEDRFDMMATPGWAAFMEEMETFEKNLNNVGLIDNEARLNFVKGQLDMVRYLRGLKSLSEGVYESLKDETNSE